MLKVFSLLLTDRTFPSFPACFSLPGMKTKQNTYRVCCGCCVWYIIQAIKLLFLYKVIPITGDELERNEQQKCNRKQVSEREAPASLCSILQCLGLTHSGRGQHQVSLITRVLQSPARTAALCSNTLREEASLVCQSRQNLQPSILKTFLLL